MPIAHTLDRYPQARGNAAVAVVVDSGQPEFAFLFETTFAALGHFGVPFRVVDLARGRLTEESIAGCPAVVLAQEYLGARLGQTGVAALLRAVDGGMGLVNFDSDLAAYGGAFLEAAGLEGAGRGGALVIDGTDGLNVRDKGHPITWYQDGSPEHRLHTPVATVLTRAVAPDEAVLLEDNAGAPMLVARPHGRGKIVQWLVSPKVWLRQYFGHTFGLDDVWLRSIVWATRKPLALKSMPPFFRFRFDDCQGLWRDARDLRFVDVLNGMGHVPSLCVCLRAVTADGAAKINSLYRAGKAEFAPHTLKPNTSLFYGDEHGEYSPARFAELFREIDETYAAWGVKPSTILSDHDHGWSTNAIPGLLQRGITYKMNITMPGETWEAVHADWHPAPYGSMDYAFDSLPAPHERFFVVHNHYPPAFAYARAAIDQDHFLYPRAGGYGPYKWDMLNGLTVGPAFAENQVQVSAQRLADQTRLGIDSGFFGGSITHSHFIQHVKEQEWREIVAGADALMPRHRYEIAPYEHIAAYARSKVQTAVVGADIEGGRLAVELEGEASVPLRLQVYADPDGLEYATETVEPFSGRARVEAAVGAVAPA